MSIFRKRIFGGGKPKAKGDGVKEGVWLACPGCADTAAEPLNRKELEANQFVCAACQYHFRIGRRIRIDQITDNGLTEEWDADMSSIDPLAFTTDLATYQEKLAKGMSKTGEREAVTTGLAKINGHRVALGVMDWEFMGASMGSVVGEKITRMIEHGTKRKLPVILFCASGGARMQEGVFSLMQMAKTSGALARHAAKGLAYVPVLTDRTMGGVTASFATLGDVIIAEPKAMIGFAGMRVIQQVTSENLPERFQTSEFLLERGLIDSVVHRHELKNHIGKLIEYTGKKNGRTASS